MFDIMNTCLRSAPFILLLIWTYLTLQGEVVKGEDAQTHAPIYSPINGKETLGKPLCPNTLDIVIAIDSSESMQSVWNKIIDDAENFIKNFQIADHLTRIGIIDFSAVANVYSPLDSNNTVESAHRVFEKLRSRPQNGETWVELGLDRAGEVFDNATPPRRNAKKVLIMYTDGESTSRDYNSLKDLVKHQREEGIETFVVTVTNTSYQPGLQILASSFAHIYHMGQQTQTGQQTLGDVVCWTQGGTDSLSLNFIDTVQNFSPGKSKCEREKDAANLVIQSMVPILVPIFVPECTPDGKYKEIQTHQGTGFHWCVNTDTGDIINGTRTVDVLPKCPHEPKLISAANNSKQPVSPTYAAGFNNFTQSQEETQMTTKDFPAIALTRCQEEREIIVEIVAKQIPSSIPITLPECDAVTGSYKPVQGDGTGYMWCVDIRTGHVLNGTRQYKLQPTCPEYEVKKRPLTTCEAEKEENLKLLSSIPDIHIPECSAFDGLYLEIQRIWVGAKYCVKRFTGDHIKGTDTEVGKPDPICPELTKCEKMQVEIHTHDYRNLTRPALLRKVIPICKRDGSFEEVQSNDLIAQYWCVNKVTGIYIEGTLVYDKKPDCSVANRPLTHCERQKVDKEKHENGAISILLCSEHDGLYIEIQQSRSTGRKYCVNRYTGDYIKATFTEPGVTPICPVKSKCEQEREKLHGLNYHNYGKPGYLERIILTCNKDGFYDLLQSDYRSHVNWCVDELTGEYISPSVMHFPRVPDCLKVSPPHTKCEREKAELGRKQLVLPETFVPRCHAYNGLYVDIQYMPTGWRWCVNSFSGERFNGTYTEPGPQQLLCPGLSLCEQEQIEAHTYNYRNFSSIHYVERFIPTCDSSGLYTNIQGNQTTSWCVDRITGQFVMHIKKSREGKLTCPGDDVSSPRQQQPVSERKHIVEESPELDESSLEGKVSERVGTLPTDISVTPQSNLSLVAPDHLATIDTFTSTLNASLAIGHAVHFAPFVNKTWLLLPPTQQNASEVVPATLIVNGSLVNDSLAQVIPGVPLKEILGDKDVAPGPVTALFSNQSEALLMAHQNTKVNIALGDYYPNGEYSDGVGLYMPSFPCAVQLDFANQNRIKYNIIGGFLPTCDEKGNYTALQSNVSSGERWCVDTQTGHEIVPSRVAKGQPNPDCYNHLNQYSIAQYGPKPQWYNATKNESVPYKNDSSPQTNGIPIQNIIQNITLTDNETSSFRNIIQTVQNGSVLTENITNSLPANFHPSSTPKNETTMSTSNTTTITANFTEAKEEMKDLGEAIGSLFGGLFSAMIPIANETTNASSIGANQTKHDIQNNQTERFLQEKAELNEYAHNCPYEIGVNLTKMGCLNDDQQIPRPLPVLLINETHINTGVMKKEDEWKSFIRGLVCKCAIETRKKGWYTFGIQSYGECFSGPDEGRYNEDGEASKDMCIDEEQGVCDEVSQQACAGISEIDKESGKKKSANYVFMIITETHKEINIIHYDRRKRKRNVNSRLKFSGHKKRRKRQL